jgi:hypothetical protein
MTIGPVTNHTEKNGRVPQVSRLRPGILRVNVHDVPCHNPGRNNQPTRDTSPPNSALLHAGSDHPTSSEKTYGPWGKVVECCVSQSRRIVAIVPLALAFAQAKSARVSTAAAIRARYQGSPRRVLFKATSINLSQDARSRASERESNRHSSHAPEYQRGITGEKTPKSPQLHPPLCV